MREIINIVRHKERRSKQHQDRCLEAVPPPRLPIRTSSATEMHLQPRRGPMLHLTTIRTCLCVRVPPHLRRLQRFQHCISLLYRPRSRHGRCSISTSPQISSLPHQAVTKGLQSYCKLETPTFPLTTSKLLQPPSLLEQRLAATARFLASLYQNPQSTMYISISSG